jgi:hypothetical protein
MNLKYIKFILLLFIAASSFTGVFAQDDDDDGRKSVGPNTKFRANFVSEFYVPIMLSNPAQRNAMRGLIGINLGTDIQVAKNFYIGFLAKYSVFQSRTTNDFKLWNRDILSHHASGGVSLSYEIKTANPKISFTPNISAGYTYVVFTNLLTGIDTSIYDNPKGSFSTGGVYFNPNIRMNLYLDEDRTGSVGFKVGASVIMYQLKKTDIYIDQESFFFDIPDNGITSHINIGITFTQKFGKIKR